MSVSRRRSRADDIYRYFPPYISRRSIVPAAPVVAAVPAMQVDRPPYWRRNFSTYGRFKFFRRRISRYARRSRNLALLNATRPELKCVDWPLGTAPDAAGAATARKMVFASTFVSRLPNTNTNPNAAPLSCIGSGDTIDTRDGRVVLIRSVHVNGVIEFLQDINGPPRVENFRMALVLDRQPNGTAPNFADIFQNLTGASSGLGAINEPSNLNYRHRFRVIKDRKFIMQHDSVDAANPGAGLAFIPRNMVYPTERRINWYVKFKRMIRVTYVDDAVAPTVASVATNQLWLLLYDSNPASAFSLSLVGNIRVRYYDV